MAKAKPDPGAVNKAIDIYLRVAYEAAPPATTVKSLLATLRTWGGEYFEAPVFAKDAVHPPTRYSVRLGNAFYPHMKLVFQLSPDEAQFLFRADAHDRHICPSPDAPEFDAYTELTQKNQRLVEAIENAWAQESLPTFKTYLRDDLARRTREG